MTLNPTVPSTQASFPHGCKVYDIADPDALGTVFAAGPEVSEVKFADGNYRNIPNAHLRPVETVKVELDNPVLPVTEPVEDVVRKGQEAWQRLRNNSTWPDWRAVGAAHVSGRAAAMRDGHVNKPKGRSYNAAFNAWLKKFGFQDLDTGDRTRLFKVMDHLAKIEAWLRDLPLAEQLRLNHPSAIWRRWKAATATPKPESESKTSPYKKLQAAHMALIEKCDRMAREIARGGGDLWSAEDRPRDITRDHR